MLLALLLLLAATTAALEQDGKDYDLYTTASALRNLAGGFASEVEVTADGRVKKLIFDGTADLLAEARALVNALGVTQGEGCEDRDCAAKELVNMMRGTVDARRRTAGEALDLAQLRTRPRRADISTWCTRGTRSWARRRRPRAPSRNPRRLMLAVVRPGDVVVTRGRIWARPGAAAVRSQTVDTRRSATRAGWSRSSRRRCRTRSSTRVSSCWARRASRAPSSRTAPPPARKTGESRQSRRLRSRRAAELCPTLAGRGGLHGRLGGRVRTTPSPVGAETKAVVAAPDAAVDVHAGSRPVDRFLLKEMSLACPSLIKVDVRAKRTTRRAPRRPSKNAGLSCTSRTTTPRPIATGTAGVLATSPSTAFLRRALSRASLKRGGGVPRGRRGPVGLAEPAARRVGRRLAGCRRPFSFMSCPAGNLPRVPATCSRG